MTISWAELIEHISACQACGLRAGCHRVVPGEGDPNAMLMFIGEGPGADEDRLGRPFVGRAGELLTKMIHSIGMERTNTYICNVVKCRPPHNRTPLPEEMDACKGFLRAQVALVRPKIIVLLGSTAGKAVLGDQFRVTRDRGRWVEKKGVWFMPTYHPSALLRDQTLKRLAWEDFKAAKAKLTAIETEEQA